MDRNLGAIQVATYMWDADAYGDLYQWGRRTDGHQCRTSSTTGTISSVDQPANGFFILTNSSPNDWRSPQNANLWQGVNGTNNPCPSGYRLPTEAEFVAERGSWTSPNRDGAFGSPLKLPPAGSRLFDTGGYVFYMQGGGGSYWTSTVSGSYSKRLDILSIGSDIYQDARAYGKSVRCIKHY